MRTLICFAALILVLALGSVGSANLLTNGSFESATVNPGSGFVTLGAGSTAITGWLVTGPIDYIGTYWQAADGVRSLDMNATSAGGVSQTFSTIAGREYLVQFGMAGNPAGGSTVKSMRVSAAGVSQDYTFSTSGHSFQNMGWADNNTFTFTATGASTILAFSSLITGAYGPTLDNVVVTEVVPEPMGVLSLLMGLGGVGASVVRLRRR